MPDDGVFVGEAMHVPGFVEERHEAFGTSPEMFTVKYFGPAGGAALEAVDKLSIFPLEGDLESAKLAVIDGLCPEEVSASLFTIMTRVRSPRCDPLHNDHYYHC